MILAGETLEAGQGQDQLGQYYGQADTAPTTVTQATFNPLSSVYTIPAGEAYAGAAYELTCGGSGTWGSTQEKLSLAMALNGATFGSGGAGQVAASALAASASFFWTAKMTIVCVDGISSWNCRLEAIVAEQANPANPGTASTNTVPVNAVLNHTASVGSPITVGIEAEWASASFAATLTNSLTTFRKIS